MSLTDYIRGLIFLNEIQDNDGDDFDDLNIDIPWSDIQAPPDDDSSKKDNKDQC